MQQHTKLKKILGKLGIKDPHNFMYNEILVGGRNIDDFVDIYNLKGGMLEDEYEIKTTAIKYKNIDFNFSSHHDKENIHYYLEENSVKCILITINKKEKKAILSGISYDPLCFPKNTNKELTNGTTLMKLSLKLIDKIKDRYKSKYISLLDHSTKSCPNLKGNRIILPMMMTLLYGETWYGKFNFRPYNEYDTKQTDFLFKKYLKNKVIMENAKMQDVKKFSEIYNNAIKKSNLSKKMENNAIDTYDTFMKNNSLIKVFLQNLLDKEIFLGNDKIKGTCVLFYNFYNELYDELGLFNFYNTSFVKIL